MMDRRQVLLTSLAGTLTAPLVAEAQHASRVYRIGWINTASPGWHDGAFQEGLRELGYVEGETSSLSGDGWKENLTGFRASPLS
jgi:hypothetical protein